MTEADLNHHRDALEDKIVNRAAEVAVIGLGYVGLALATEFATAGFRVTGLELNGERVEALLGGASYVPDVSSALVRRLVADGLLCPTQDPARLAPADVFIICVPTPLRRAKEPDISHVLAAIETIAGHLRAGQLIVLESTTYPGTTEEILLPAVESAGWKVGVEVFVAFSPERVDPGNKAYPTREIPKIVGGVTAACTEMARVLYSQVVCRAIPVASPKVAEMAKVLENTYRSVNIALANEFALICRRLGIDPWAVIEAAGSKPFGFTPFYPGPGIGGHCIPVDPLYLSWKARAANYEPRFIALADEINRTMPRHVIDLVAEALNNVGKCLRGSRILVLGVAYKRGINDVRESPALEILEGLLRGGALVAYSDPHVPSLALNGAQWWSRELDAATLAVQDCVVIVTDHAEVDYQAVADHAPLVVDTRNATRHVLDPHATIVHL